MLSAVGNATDLDSQTWVAQETILQRFEDAWKQGRRPAVEDYLPPSGPLRQAVLCELVHTDLEFRLKDAEEARVEHYLVRFQELRGDPTIELELIATEMELRLRRTPDLALSEYLDRFPHHRAALLTVWQGMHPSVETLPIPASRREPIEGAEDRLSKGVVRPSEAAKSSSDLDRSSLRPMTRSQLGKYELIKELGRGNFGIVYLARDSELDRDVALKVVRAGRLATPMEGDWLLREARILAGLDHPNIVTVYDAGRTDEGLCYIVSKYIEGKSLAEQMRQDRPSFRESAELVATVADAVHHAHLRDLVHQDLKPANLLIDLQGKPCVADFGLAMRDEDSGKEGDPAGTAAYMSPEQALGEGHRVDGRSDIFSLGIIFYELLTGRRPFRGKSRPELTHKIATAEPRPPRQVDDAIPKELERIALKALSKRISERYTTARDMAEDLRNFLRAEAETTSPPPAIAPAGPTSEASSTPHGSGRPESVGSALKIVPKGLRPFDQHDAAFFLDLLPGPRDQDGLPDGLRFWKTRIESVDPDTTFRVGLIYGPSGCGKSSLVKAGLLPRLAPNVCSVYVEATPHQTETRLLKALHKACPDLPDEAGLVNAISQLRRGRVLRSGRKVLLVLDQFEQWLFARQGRDNSELVAALRQCDGEHIQAIVLVRDDFWMAANRFMMDLEIDLAPNANIALVDLFDPRHARKVPDGLRSSVRRLARGAGRPHQGPAILPRSGDRRTRAGGSGHLGATGAVRRDGQGEALGPVYAAGGRWYRWRRREVPGGNLRLAPGKPEVSPAPEGGPGRSEGAVASRWCGNQGPDAIRSRVARSLGLRQPAPGLRPPRPGPWLRAATDHTDGPRGLDG